MEKAWDITTGSPDVVIAVIDTGVDIEHEDLKENIWTNAGEIPENGLDDDRNGYIDDVHGWNFVLETNDVQPSFDPDASEEAERAFVHGTLVASLIAAKGNNARGIAGIAWNAMIMPLVGLDVQGTGSTTDVAEAVRYAVRNGADIINLSIEGTLRDEDLDEALALARSEGVVTVTASGNATEEGGKDLDIDPTYPACSSLDGAYGVLTVGGTDRGDLRASFSDYGSCLNLVAPSVDIAGASPEIDGDPSSSYTGFWSGTSLATPLVAGAAALVKTLHPDWGATQIRERLISTADSVDASNSAYVNKLGRGRLNVLSALTKTKEILPESLRFFGTKPGSPSRIRITSDTEDTSIGLFGDDDMRGVRLAITDMDEDGSLEIGAVPATGDRPEFVLLSWDGRIRDRIALPGTLKNGALVVGTDDGFVVADADGGAAWGIDRNLTVRRFYPYEAQYADGLDVLSVSGAAAFAPRNGGGRLVIANAKGEQLVSAFPFGMEPSGRWSLAIMESEEDSWIVFSGPSGTKRIGTSVMGQIGWEDVSFDTMASSHMIQSSGIRADSPAYVEYVSN